MAAQEDLSTVDIGTKRYNDGLRIPMSSLLLNVFVVDSKVKIPHHIFRSETRHLDKRMVGERGLRFVCTNVERCHSSVSVNLASSAMRFPQYVILNFLCSISSLL